MRRIYLDYAATSPSRKEVIRKMTPYFGQIFANPNSLHSPGQKANRGVDEARRQVADFLKCKKEEIIFTSGATESNNLAIRGVIESCLKRDKKLHIITTQIEHPAVLEPCCHLEKQGVEVTYLSCNREGLIELEKVEKAIKPETVLISVMYANNEVGTIQPIREIGQLIKKINQERKLPIVFHNDAVQALNYQRCEVGWLGVDLLSFSGHKIYGPKGIGVLYVKKGTPLTRIQLGGHHENGLRAGTLNVPGIVGVGEAVRLIQKDKEETARVKKLRDKLIEGVLNQVPGAKLNGSREKRLPNNVNFSFRGVEGESLLLALDLEGIAISTGSACASGSLEPSHVLLALGLSKEEAHASARFTLGRSNTEKDIERVIDVVVKVVGKLRKISGKKIKN